MNNQTAKQLRKIAEELPPIIHRRQVITRKLGKDLPEGTPIKKCLGFSPTKLYNHHTFVVVNIDHEKRIKTIFKLQGEAGVIKYIESVKRSYPANKATAEKLGITQGKKNLNRWQRFKKFIKQLFSFK